MVQGGAVGFVVMRAGEIGGVLEVIVHYQLAIP